MSSAAALINNELTRIMKAEDRILDVLELLMIVLPT
jgi:hypothetical protein